MCERKSVPTPAARKQMDFAQPTFYILPHTYTTRQIILYINHSVSGPDMSAKVGGRGGAGVKYPRYLLFKSEQYIQADTIFFIYLILVTFYFLEIPLLDFVSIHFSLLMFYSPFFLCGSGHFQALDPDRVKQTGLRSR